MPENDKNVRLERINSRIARVEGLLADPNTQDKRKELLQKRLERLNERKEKFSQE